MQTDLTGQFLIAMPGMGDPRFAASLVVICSHSEEGAMGLIVNKRVGGVSFEEFFSGIDLETHPDVRFPIRFGGPVDVERGFVLHSRDGQSAEGTLEITDALALTATRDVLAAMLVGKGPRRALFAVGYAGWGAGQLEAEIADNGWLTSDISEALIFGEDDEGKWEGALRALGVDPAHLSVVGGRA